MDRYLSHLQDNAVEQSQIEINNLKSHKHGASLELLLSCWFFKNKTFTVKKQDVVVNN